MLFARRHMLSLFKIPVFYVQLSAERVLARNPQNGTQISEAADLATRSSADGKTKIVAVGNEARLAAAQDASVQFHQPLSHPRTLIADFVMAEALLQYCLRKLVGKRGLFMPSPRLILQPHQPSEGGLTQVELRALNELGLSAGASKVQIWQGAEWSDEQLLSGKAPATGAFLSEAAATRRAR